MDDVRITRIQVSEIGPLWLTESVRGVCRLAFKNPGSPPRLKKGVCIGRMAYNDTKGDVRTKKMTMAKLCSMKADISGGTPFQRAVWRAISSIPPGETRSYAWVARKAGRPRAIRAAANACGANPLPIIIPCHRVVSSDGSLGGFSSGLAIKRKLLALEGHRSFGRT